MTFDKILPILKDGSPVRRKAWAEDLCIVYFDRKVVWVSPSTYLDGTDWTPSAACLFADDWESA